MTTCYGTYVVVGRRYSEPCSEFLWPLHHAAGMPSVTLVRSVVVRYVLRRAKSMENSSEWLADRDFPISIVSLAYDSNLWNPKAVSGEVKVAAKPQFASWVWLANYNLPAHDEANSVHSMGTCREISFGNSFTGLANELLNTMHVAVDALKDSTENQAMKRRLSQVLDILLGQLTPQKVCALDADVAQVGQKWPSVAKWIVGAERWRTDFVALRPGLGDLGQTSLSALCAFRQQLLFKALKESSDSSKVLVQVGTVRMAGKSDVSNIFVPQLYRSSFKESSRNRRVWVASIAALQDILIAGNPSAIECCFIPRFVVGEGNHQLSLSPALSSDFDHVRVVIVIEEDLHKYNMIYECWARAAADCMRLEANNCVDGIAVPHDYPLFRDWAGLHCDAVNNVDLIFGDRSHREAVISSMSDEFSYNFSPFQKRCILDIQKRVTFWEFAAGAGKSMMLRCVCACLLRKNSTNLVFFTASSYRVLEDIKAALESFVRTDELMYLNVYAGEDGIVDEGDEILARIVCDEMRREELMLKAIDNGLSILHELMSVDSWSTLSSQCGQRARKLYTALLAHRHEFLDQHFYVTASRARKLAMKRIRVVVCTTSRLQKLMGRQSSWWSFFDDDTRSRVILADESEGTSTEGFAALCPLCDFLLAAGDSLQSPDYFKQKGTRCEKSFFNTLQSQLQHGTPSTSQSTHCSPLGWTLSFGWAQEAGKRCGGHVCTVTCFEQHRYGKASVELVRAVFPKSLGKLSCAIETPDTLVVPCVFENLYEHWDYGENIDEVQRCRSMFSVALCMIAVEMVLARSRLEHRSDCWILVMASRYSVLRNLEALVREHACRIALMVHHRFGLSQSDDLGSAYIGSEWIDKSRIQFKVKQDAHGSNGEVTFNFVTGRQKQDWSWAGDEINQAFLLEGLTRSLLRQHILMEDLSEHAPVVGRTHGANNSTVRKTVHLLALLKHLDQVMKCDDSLSARCHRVGITEFQCLPFFQLKSVRSQIAAESVCGSQLSLKLSQDGWSQSCDLIAKCAEAYDAMSLWPPENFRGGFSKHSRTSDAEELSRVALFGRSDVQVRNWENLLSRLCVEVSSPCLPPWTKYRAAFVHSDSCSDSPWCSSVSVETIQQISVPTVCIHLEHLDTKWPQDEVYSASATHYCNVTIPLAPWLLNDSVDVNDVLIRLSLAAWPLFRSSDAYSGLAEVGDVSQFLGRHKKKEVEIGNARFVVEACHSDRPAVIWLMSYSDGKQVELLHFYHAMGLSRQHSSQAICLARCRNFTVADCIVRATIAMCGTDRFSIHATSVDDVERDRLGIAWEYHSYLKNNVVSCLHTLLPLADDKLLSSLVHCTGFDHFSHFLPHVPLGDDWTALCNKLLSDIASLSTPAVVASSLAGCSLLEPVVVCTHEHPSYQTPPGVICLPDVGMHGTLLWGGLSHALHKEWLVWKGVTTVLCCMGSKAGSAENADWRLAKNSFSGCKQIDYLNWVVSYPKDRVKYFDVFETIRKALTHAANRVYVFCKSGNDRSAFTIYALLRISFRMTELDAIAALRTRADIYGREVLQFQSGFAKEKEWLNSIIERAAL